MTLPALLIGLLLRAIFMMELPLGILHPDSADLLVTPDRLIQKTRWNLHPKKTFLVPILYTAAFAIPKVPVLTVIPAAQHALGLATVAIAALLCRCWFRHWRALVVPVTLLLAVNPTLIWFEHALMTESVFVFTTALLALAGTLYALNPEKRTFVFLCIALVLEAGARPEGKLFFGFGFLLIFLAAWPRWKTALRPLALLLLLAIPTHLATRTSQAGLLLYTSLLRIAPEHSKIAPGVEAYTAPIRDSLVAEWTLHPAYPNSTQRTALGKELNRYLEDRQQPHQTAHVEKLCKRLAIEAILQKPSAIPALILHKWHCTAWRSPSEDFSEIFLKLKHSRAVQNSSALILRNAQAIVGQPFADETAVETFFASIDNTSATWLNRWTEKWSTFFSAWRTPDTVYPDGFVERGLPCTMIISLLGLILIMRRPPASFHIAWSLALIGLFLVILLTANVRPRFRLFFEPYWLLGLAAILDIAASFALRWLKRP